LGLEIHRENYSPLSKDYRTGHYVSCFNVQMIAPKRIEKKMTGKFLGFNIKTE